MSETTPIQSAMGHAAPWVLQSHVETRPFRGFTLQILTSELQGGWNFAMWPGPSVTKQPPMYSMNAGYCPPGEARGLAENWARTVLDAAMSGDE